MFSDDGSTGRSAGHFILWQTHSTRDHLSLTAGKSGSTPSRDRHARDQVPPDGEGGRLHAARQRMLTGELDAASAAFEVGYESPSQFSREYRRFFGRPPIRDMKALRDGKVVATTV